MSEHIERNDWERVLEQGPRDRDDLIRMGWVVHAQDYREFTPEYLEKLFWLPYPVKKYLKRYWYLRSREYVLEPIATWIQLAGEDALRNVVLQWYSEKHLNLEQEGEAVREAITKEAARWVENPGRPWKYGKSNIIRSLGRHYQERLKQKQAHKLLDASGMLKEEAYKSALRECEILWGQYEGLTLAQAQDLPSPGSGADADERRRYNRIRKHLSRTKEKYRELIYF